MGITYQTDAQLERTYPLWDGDRVQRIGATCVLLVTLTRIGADQLKRWTDPEIGPTTRCAALQVSQDNRS